MPRLRIPISNLCYRAKRNPVYLKKNLHEVKCRQSDGKGIVGGHCRGTKMSEIERIGVSLEKELLGVFDDLIGRKGYPSRSEAIRDLIRQQMSVEKLGNPKAKAVAAVFLVYEHHSTKLMGMLTDLQHSHFLQVISSMHIHLDEHDCLEVIVMRGPVGEINRTAENIISLKGVKLGRINLLATEAA
jgi:CopG family nickel-responsive transcriptional regulator